MKIGIVRHFKVDCKKDKYMNTHEFSTYIDTYDRADIIIDQVKIDQEQWKKCYCSDLLRAVKTAEALYKGEIKQSQLIREVPMAPIVDVDFRLHSSWWSISSRLAWLVNHTVQQEGRRATKQRAEAFIEDLKDEEDILIVSHGFFLITLVKLLRKQGFKGYVPLRMKNGEVYVLEKN